MKKQVILLSSLHLLRLSIILASLIFLTNFISFLLAGTIHMLLKGNIIYSSLYSAHLVETRKTEELKELEQLLHEGGPGTHLIAALFAGVVFGAILYFIKSFFWRDLRCLNPTFQNSRAPASCNQCKMLAFFFRLTFYYNLALLQVERRLYALCCLTLTELGYLLTGTISAPRLKYFLR